jgi:hypothetical protein
MTPEQIRAAIAARPELAGVTDTHTLAAALSVGRTRMRSRMVSERGILDTYPGGPVAADALLTRLEAFAATAVPLASIVARALRFLRMPDGIDLGAPATVVMLDALAQGGAITTTEREHLRAMVTEPDPVDEMSVRRAIWADDGTLLI